MVTKLGVGIVGANWAARGHLPGWRMLPGRVRPIGICTRNLDGARDAAAELGLDRAYGGFDAMLDDPDIAIVSLGGPPPARFEMTMAALERGRHVFSCIPFAVTVDQVAQMARLQQEKGLVGALDAYFLWTPGYSFLKDLIDAGILGDRYAINVDFSMAHFVMPGADYAYRWTGYAGNGTGVLPNSCSHIFHMLIGLFGPVHEVVAQTKLAKSIWTFDDGTTQRPEVPDTAVVLARMENGALVNIHAGRAVPGGPGLTLTAYGSKGRIIARSPAYPLDRNVTLGFSRPARMFEGTEEALDIPDRYFAVPGEASGCQPQASAALSLGRLYAAMIGAIEGTGPPPQPDFARGAQVQSIVAALERSEIERRWIVVEPAGAYQMARNGEDA